MLFSGTLIRVRRAPWAGLFILLTYIAVPGIVGAATTRVYIEPFGTGSKQGLEKVREDLVDLLKKEHGISVVNDSKEADAVVSGSGETYIKGYFNRNYRVRYITSDSKPIYDGYLSVELKNREQDTVWSYLVTPARFGSEDIYKNLARQMVKKLVPQIENKIHAQRP